MMRLVMALTAVLIAITLVLLVWFAAETKGDRCAEYCYPNNSDLIDMEDVP